MKIQTKNIFIAILLGLGIVGCEAYNSEQDSPNPDATPGSESEPQEETANAADAAADLENLLGTEAPDNGDDNDGTGTPTLTGEQKPKTDK